jgi:hypothetical protein
MLVSFPRLLTASRLAALHRSEEVSATSISMSRIEQLRGEPSSWGFAVSSLAVAVCSETSGVWWSGMGLVVGVACLGVWVRLVDF